MASERKKFLKEQIVGKIKNFIENSDISLEELEDSFAELDSMMINTDDLTTLQEKIDDKQSNPIRKNRKKSI